MERIVRSARLVDVSYAKHRLIQGRARRMEQGGYRIIRLDVANPAQYGFGAPDEIITDVILNLPKASGYCESQGLFPARKAVMQYAQAKGIRGVEVEDVHIGNGVSELMMLTMQALLNTGDEVLIPAPDYPLWSLSVGLAQGVARHYTCNEEDGWLPDLGDIEAKITRRTRALVVINPNNPTGALYPVDVLQSLVSIARSHRLILFADETLDKILYDGAQHTSVASVAGDTLCFTFSGLSKNYRAPGYRAGWVVISGERSHAEDYIEGFSLLASMRLCSNVPGQHAIQTALGGHQSIEDLVAPTGRLRQQRDLAWKLVSEIPGVSCVKPKAAMYLFLKLDPQAYPIPDDQQFVLNLLEEEKVLLVPGTAFNYSYPDHVRMTFLAQKDDIIEAIDRVARFLEKYRKRGAA